MYIEADFNATMVQSCRRNTEISSTLPFAVRKASLKHPALPSHSIKFLVHHLHSLTDIDCFCSIYVVKVCKMELRSTFIRTLDLNALHVMMRCTADLGPNLSLNQIMIIDWTIRYTLTRQTPFMHCLNHTIHKNSDHKKTVYTQYSSREPN